MKSIMEKLRIATFILLLVSLILLTLTKAALAIFKPECSIEVPMWLYILVSALIAGFGWIPANVVTDIITGIFGSKKKKEKDE